MKADDTPDRDRTAADLREEDVTAFVRGELEGAAAERVRAALDADPALAALAAEARRVLALTAARPSAEPSAAAREALLAHLHGVAEEPAAAAPTDAPARPVLPAGPPRLRLLERAGARYAESRTVRFLTVSLGVHAAAAALFAAWLGFSPDSPLRRPVPQALEVGELRPLPELEGDRRGTRPSSTGVTPDGVSPVDPFPMPVEDPETWFGGGLEDHADLPANLGRGGLYPNEEFRAFAAPRFRRETRRRRLAGAWGPEAGPRTATALADAMGWLAARQAPDGTWASGAAADDPAARDRYRIGVTATTVRAFLADGHTALRRGPHRRVVRRAVEVLAASGDATTGLLGARPGAAALSLADHAPTLAALAESWGLDYGLMEPETRERLGAVVRRGIAATVAAQLPDGAFGHEPGAVRGDVSVTLLQIDALETARLAGFAVDPAVLRRAAEFVRGRLEAGDPLLTAEALALPRPLRFDGPERERLLTVALGDANPAGTPGLLRRTALLEALVAAADGTTLGRLGPAWAGGTLDRQRGDGAFPVGDDPEVRAGGDALATARTVRALTAPFRHAAP